MDMNGNTMTSEDAARLHELLDYAIESDQNYVVAEYARMSLDWQLRRKRYWLSIKTEEDERRVDD